MNVEEPIIDSMETLEKHYGYDRNDLDKGDWYQISKLEMSEDFLEEYKDKIDWDEHLINWVVDENIIRKYHKYISSKSTWDSISYNEGLSKEFIYEFKDKLDPVTIIEYQKALPLKLVIEWLKESRSNEDLIDKVLQYQKITSSMLSAILKYDPDCINPTRLSRDIRLSKRAIYKHPDEFNWDLVSQYRRLGEDVIYDFKHKVNWSKISEFQKLSADFIIKMSEYIDVDALKKNKVINQKKLEEKEIYTFLRLAK